MKIHEECLPCLVNQAIRTAQMLQLEDRESLYQKIFQHMSRMDFIGSKIFFTVEMADKYSIIAHLCMFEIYTNLSILELGNNTLQSLKLCFHNLCIGLFVGTLCKVLEFPHYNMYKHNTKHAAVSAAHDVQI